MPIPCCSIMDKRSLCLFQNHLIALKNLRNSFMFSSKPRENFLYKGKSAHQKLQLHVSQGKINLRSFTLVVTAKRYLIVWVRSKALNWLWNPQVEMLRTLLASVITSKRPSSCNDSNLQKLSRILRLSVSSLVLVIQKGQERY